MTAFEKRKSEALLKLRVIRGHLLTMKDAIGQFEREKKSREALDLVGEIEKEIHQLHEDIEHEHSQSLRTW